MAKNMAIKQKNKDMVVLGLKVLYRQNASWQGIVTTEKGETYFYRSELELIKIIDAYLEGREISAPVTEPSASD